MVSDTIANATRAAHDWGLASYLGGAMFGKFALNPAVRVIEDKADRGKVTNTAWNGYNVINAVSLGAVATGWGAARLTEARPDRLSGRERDLAKVKDGFVISTLLAGIASGIQGAARQAGAGWGGAGGERRRACGRDTQVSRDDPALAGCARQPEHRLRCRPGGHERDPRPDQPQPPAGLARHPAT